MIISPTQGYAFVHIHKCAGTSIEIALASRLGVNDLVIGSTPGGERLMPLLARLTGLRKHSTAAEARAALGAEYWAGLYTFAFVRQPVDRLRSLYTYALARAAKRPLDKVEAATLANDGTFPKRPPFRFKAVQAASLVTDFDGFVCHPLTWQDQGAKPQWQSLCDDSGRLLVDFVGKVEQIERDWAVVEQRLGYAVALPHSNQSRPPLDKPLSPEARARLAEHYARDFEFFGYVL